MNRINLVRHCVQAAIAIVAVLTVLSYLGGAYWAFDLIAHWRVQLAICALLGLAALLTLRRRYGAHVTFLPLAFVLFLANSYPVVAFYRDTPDPLPPGPAEAVLKVMSLNVLKRNDRHDDVLAEIRRQDPDLLLVLEVSPGWTDALGALHDRYPHRIVAPRTGRFGIALYSKNALLDGRVEEWGKFRIPYIVAATTDRRGRRIALFGVHTLTPLTRECASDGHAQARHVMRLATQVDGPAALIGDWNRTPWSHSYRELMREFDLRNTVKGFVPLGTWRPLLLGGLTIDHVFVKNMRSRNWHTGSDVGSDHRAIVVEIQAD